MSRKSAEVCFNENLKKLDQDLLDDLIIMISEGAIAELAAKELMIDWRSVEGMRTRSVLGRATPWDHHVHHSLDQAEAAFANKVAKKWLNSVDRTELEANRSYLEVVRPRYNKAHQMSQKYEANVMMEMMKAKLQEYVPEMAEIIFIATCEALAAADGTKVVAALDERILYEDTPYIHKKLLKDGGK